MIRYVAIGAVAGFLFAYFLLSGEAPAPAAVPAPAQLVQPDRSDRLLRVRPTGTRTQHRLPIEALDGSPR